MDRRDERNWDPVRNGLMILGDKEGRCCRWIDIHKAKLNEKQDALLRVPQTLYYRTRYREMSFPPDPIFLRYFSDDETKKLYFKEKLT